MPKNKGHNWCFWFFFNTPSLACRYAPLQCTICNFIFKFGGSYAQIIKNNFEFDKILIILGAWYVFAGKKFNKFEGKMSVIFILCHI
jgi:hypothetical protein